MIESGTLTPGISPAAFGLPDGTALRYERPAEALRPFLPSYAVLDSEPDLFKGPSSWLLPSWGKIWIGLTAGPISVEIFDDRYDLLGAAVLYGVTSRAMPVTSNGGITIVIDVSPSGWARLFPQSAEQLRDRITPLDQLLAPSDVADLVQALYRSDRSTEVKGILDDFFLRHLPPPHPDQELVAQITALLLDDTVSDLKQAAEALGISAPKLLRLTKRCFGFPPKLLMMRARFIRALTAMLTGQGKPDFSMVPRGYHDASHFIRDGKRFLGMTPRRFLAMPMPYLRAALRARELVIDTPTPSLDPALPLPDGKRPASGTSSPRHGGVSVSHAASRRATPTPRSATPRRSG